MALPVSHPSRHPLRILHPLPFNLFSTKAEATERTSGTVPTTSHILSPLTLLHSLHFQLTMVQSPSPHFTWRFTGLVPPAWGTALFLSGKVESLLHSLTGDYELCHELSRLQNSSGELSLRPDRLSLPPAMFRWPVRGLREENT